MKSLPQPLIIFAIAVLALISWYAMRYLPSLLQNERSVLLYYYDPSKDADAAGNILCSRKGLVPVIRRIANANPVEDSIRLLLRGGLSEAEQATGITSEYPLPGVALVTSDLKNGILTLTLDDPLMKTSGGSCRAGILWFEIEATAKQFSEVQRVQFLPENLFQP